jgi:purine-nucleoside phosphorylase
MRSTPHIKLAEGIGFAKTVLMPGDPLRAKFIAENFLEQPVLVNNVRGVMGHTGMYKGVPVSVMASGMGMPSMGIYSYELFSFFGVDNIIRVGSAGAISKDLNLLDIVAAMGACTNSNYAQQYNLPGTFAPIASYKLLKLSDECAREMGKTLRIGNVLSSDTFYDDASSGLCWDKMGVLAVEMEAAALYMNAARLSKNALAICTVSDLLFDSSRELTPKEREQSLGDMITLALEIARCA